MRRGSPRPPSRRSDDHSDQCRRRSNPSARSTIGCTGCADPRCREERSSGRDHPPGWGDGGRRRRSTVCRDAGRCPGWGRCSLPRSADADHRRKTDHRKFDRIGTFEWIAAHRIPLCDPSESASADAPSPEGHSRGPLARERNPHHGTQAVALHAELPGSMGLPAGRSHAVPGLTGQRHGCRRCRRRRRSSGEHPDRPVAAHRLHVRPVHGGTHAPRDGRDLVTRVGTPGHRHSDPTIVADEFTRRAARTRLGRRAFRAIDQVAFGRSPRSRCPGCREPSRHEELAGRCTRGVPHDDDPLRRSRPTGRRPDSSPDSARTRTHVVRRVCTSLGR